jgi:quercetin dioxygenase-like cupin family protein
MNKIQDFTKGWLVGDFSPSIYNTKEIEVGIKEYKKGDVEKNHVHKIATEYTIVISGKVEMLGNVYEAGDIVKIEPNIPNIFKCEEDCKLLVIKTPSVIGDKYEI